MDSTPCISPPAKWMSAKKGFRYRSFHGTVMVKIRDQGVPPSCERRDGLSDCFEHQACKRFGVPSYQTQR
jgi:hypothetical protein